MSYKKLYVYYCVINEFRNYILEDYILVRFIFGNIVWKLKCLIKVKKYWCIKC